MKTEVRWLEAETHTHNATQPCRRCQWLLLLRSKIQFKIDMKIHLYIHQDKTCRKHNSRYRSVTFSLKVRSAEMKPWRTLQIVILQYDLTELVGGRCRKDVAANGKLWFHFNNVKSMNVSHTSHSLAVWMYWICELLYCMHFKAEIEPIVRKHTW